MSQVRDANARSNLSLIFMKHHLLITCFVLLTVSLYAQSYSGPESVEYDPAGHRYFISNTNSGNILERSSAGTLSVFTSLPSSPHGLHIAGNTLYVCDGASVKGYDLTTAAEVMNLNLGATFLNGITGDGANDLYLTDFTAKKIYRVDISAQTSNVFVTGLAKSPNGIIYDGSNSRLLFVNWGTNAPVWQVNLADSVASQVTATTLGNCDGITRDSQGNYYITAWGTQSMYRFDNTFSSAPVPVTTGLNNPADICYNAAGDTIAIPNAGNNTVKFVCLSCSGAGVSETQKEEIEIYPLPASDVITIRLGKAWKDTEYVLYDSKGAVVFIGACGFGNEISLSLNGLPAGVYNLYLKGSDRSAVKKVIKS
jgi:hypothetical protein